MPNADPHMEVLRQALPLIAGVGGGAALITDNKGKCLQAVSADGNPNLDMVGKIFESCRQAAEEGRPVGVVEGEFNHRFYAIPIDGYVLAASNEDRADRQSRVFETLKETLPLIAKVAGGEAILFDADGRRLATADPKSDQIQSSPEEVSESSRKAMQTSKPDIGPSISTAGATAVRIPICAAFGFGFNNTESTRQRTKLLEQVRRNRTAKYEWSDIVGHDSTLADAFEAATSAAESQSYVILVGESGTGKELFAQAIHNGSERANKPFVAINCGALPESLVESTLFGYEDGAFTGARKGGQKGIFEQADGGTLLLDEISEMAIDQQTKLLRVLQEHEITRIGGQKSIAVDVRVICTSNRDLEIAIAENTFRADLYYRLSVMDIRLPPLRDHCSDIPALIEAIRGKLSNREGRPLLPLTNDIIALLQAYEWPGNVRELENVIDRAYNLAGNRRVEIRHLPKSIVEHGKTPTTKTATDIDDNTDARSTLTWRLATTEREVLLETLDRCDGNRTRAAKELGISVTTLWRRLKKNPGAVPVRGP